MSTYHAPLKDMLFVMKELAGLEQVGKLPGYEDATVDTVTAILEEAAKDSAPSCLADTDVEARPVRAADLIKHKLLRPPSRGQRVDQK